MKYRLIELLRCPDHPDEILRVTDARVSDVFPCAGEVRAPVCRAACGLLANWFIDIPDGLPPAHRLDCRRCLGMEIESARLVCPVCACSLEVVDGVLGLGSEAPGEPEPEAELPPKVGLLAERLLGLRAGDLAFVLAPLPNVTLERWVCGGVERLQMEPDSETLMLRRARSCANGMGLEHFLAPPLEPSVLRPGQFDAIIAAASLERFACSPDAIGLIPSLLKPSGRLLLLFPRGRKERGPPVERLLGYRESLPNSYRELDGRITPGPAIDLVLLESPPLPIAASESVQAPPGAE